MTKIAIFNRSKRTIVTIPSANNSLISFEVSVIRFFFSIGVLRFFSVGLLRIYFVADPPYCLDDFFTIRGFFNLIS